MCVPINLMLMIPEFVALPLHGKISRVIAATFDIKQLSKALMSDKWNIHQKFHVAKAAQFWLRKWGEKLRRYL